MTFVTVNSKVQRARRAVRGGREYLVAPASLIVPGVLPGSRGPLYYPPEEVGRNPADWDGIPLVVYHPTRNGRNVSASHPGVVEESGVGFVQASRYGRLSSGGKERLGAEAWFDVEKTRAYDARLAENGVAPVLPRLERGEPVEISTGLFLDTEPVSAGAVDPVSGRPYSYVARNYRPDHLAILPDQVGACSVKDGCGLLVNRRNGDDRVWAPVRNAGFFAECERDDRGRCVAGSGGKAGGSVSVVAKPSGAKVGRPNTVPTVRPATTRKAAESAKATAQSSSTVRSLAKTLLKPVAQFGRDFKENTAIGLHNAFVRPVKNVVDRHAREDAKAVVKGLFSRMTLGTGPLIVKAASIGVKHSPKAFRLLAKGMAAITRAAGRATGASAGGSIRSRTVPAGTRVVSVNRRWLSINAVLDQDSLMEGLGYLEQMRQLLDDDPEEADRFFEACKAVMEELEEEPEGNAFCPTGEGGGVDPTCGKKTRKGSTSSPKPLAATASKTPDVKLRIDAVASKVTAITAAVSEAKQKLVALQSDLKVAKLELTAVKAEVKKSVAASRSAYSTAKKKQQLPKAKEASGPFNAPNVASRLNELANDWAGKAQEDYDAWERKITGKSHGSAKSKTPSSDEMEKQVHEVLGKTSPHQVAKELGYSQKFKNVNEARKAIIHKILGRPGAILRGMA